MTVNINISNYEGYLLSAIDGELSEEEMAALELFLEQYPEIRKELSLLESTRMTPDMGMIFDGKEGLHRDSQVLSATNYESFLLAYVDNELHGPEKVALELLIQQQPRIQQELALLKAAVLTPDLTVTFTGKTSLYRRERTHVRPLWWWSAAAVLVGLAVWMLPRQYSGGNTQVVMKQQTGIKEEQSKSTSPLIANKAELAGNRTETVHTVTVTNMQKAKVERAGHAMEGLRNNNQASVAKANERTTVNEKAHMPDNAAPVLAKLPQPIATSEEVVQQLQEKNNEKHERILAENVSNVSEKMAVMANAEKISTTAVSTAATAASATDVKGELMVSVTMNGDSKLLNGVANVARFFSRKKK